ncbi:MAG TPA: family 16 glycosylhydrolase [Saprospiraceae bacterium]|nr:family 16 glycosylhydrolase [Saprospiraceae bacterium]
MRFYSYPVLAGVLITLILVACNDKENPVPTPNELPVLTWSDISVTEAEYRFPVDIPYTITGTFTEPIRIILQTEDGTAVANEDYVPQADHEIVIQPGTTSGFIRVDVIGDEGQEADETFTLRISSNKNVKVSQSKVIITLTNNDLLDQSGYQTGLTGYDAATAYDGYALKWSDEFSGDAINADNWSFEIGNGDGGWGNNELEYYRKENAYLKEGYLIIQAREESFADLRYTSARLVTKGKQSFRYGRLDIRAALPVGQGIWPALWLLGENIDAVGWPACGEIDLMEYLGHEPAKTHGTLHYGPSFAEWAYQSREYSLPEGDFHNEFHVFSLLWDENGFKWLVDDVPYAEIGSNTIAPVNPFNGNFFFIINLAVGGNWPGRPDSSTEFPQFFLVDYIRYYQQNQ